MDYLPAIRIIMYTAVVSAISQLTIPMNIVNKCIQAHTGVKLLHHRWWSPILHSLKWAYPATIESWYYG